MTHKTYHSNTFNKYSLVIWIIAIALVAIGGYSYFGGKTPNAGSCPIMSNKSVKTMQELSPSPQSSSPSFQKTDPQIQIITMNYNESWLTPTTVNVKSGQKYQIVINANTDVYGCMNAITLPGLDDNLQQITKGSKIVFNITPTKAGTYDFVCAMGVPHGASIIVQ